MLQWLHKIQIDTKIQENQSEINTWAKHAPIALTLLGYFSMATIKALKTQEGDASPSGILNPFLNHTTKAMKQDITMFNSYAYMNMKDITM